MLGVAHKFEGAGLISLKREGASTYNTATSVARTCKTVLKEEVKGYTIYSICYHALIYNTRVCQIITAGKTNGTFGSFNCVAIVGLLMCKYQFPREFQTSMSECAGLPHLLKVRRCANIAHLVRAYG